MVVNVAMAWGCASFVNFSPNSNYRMTYGPGLTSETGTCWRLRKYEYFGYTFLVGRAIFEADRMNASLIEYNPDNIPHVPVWSRFVDPPTIPMRIIEESRGWPFRTLFWDYTFDNSTSTYQHLWRVRLFSKRVYLPLAPIWSGLFLNTLFYAIFLWLFFTGFLALRRKFRFRRDLCPTCAYDLRGADHEACPECGTGVRKVRPA